MPFLVVLLSVLSSAAFGYGENTRLMGQAETPGDCVDVYVIYPYAYIADFSGGLSIMDISSPRDMTIVGADSTGTAAVGIVVRDTLAFIADKDIGFYIVNVADVSRPFAVGQVFTPAEALELCLAGDYAFVACGFQGVMVYDISDPTDPVAVRQIDISGSARRVRWESDFLFVAESWVGSVEQYYVADPANPVFVDKYLSSDAYVYDLEPGKNGPFLYVANATKGLAIGRFADPYNPSFLGRIYTPGKIAWGISASDSLVFLAEGEDGIEIINVVRPSSPVLAGDYRPHFPDLYFTVQVFAIGDFVFMADVDVLTLVKYDPS